MTRDDDVKVARHIWPQTARINPPLPGPCQHLVIHGWVDAETKEPVAFWSCAECRMRFHTATLVAELKRKIAELQADACSECPNMIGRI